MLYAVLHGLLQKSSCGHDMGTSTGTGTSMGAGVEHDNLVEHEPKCSKIGVSVSYPFKDPCRVCRVNVT